MSVVINGTTGVNAPDFSGAAVRNGANTADIATIWFKAEKRGVPIMTFTASGTVSGNETGTACSNAYGSGAAGTLGNITAFTASAEL